MTRSSGRGRRDVIRQRRDPSQRDINDEAVLKLEFDRRWEGPGDAFQTIVESMDGLEASSVEPTGRWLPSEWTEHLMEDLGQARTSGLVGVSTGLRDLDTMTLGLSPGLYLVPANWRRAAFLQKPLAPAVGDALVALPAAQSRTRLAAQQ